MKTSFVFAILCLVFLSCKNEIKPCYDRACPALYRALNLSVRYNDGTAVSLDSFNVIHLPEKTRFGMLYTPQEYMRMQDNGNYLIIGQAEAYKLFGQKIRLQFSGYRNGQKVVNETLAATIDCCGVELNEGSDNIILKN